MAVVGLSEAEARQAIAGNEDSLSVAVVNSDTSTVLSGDPLALEAVMDRCIAEDIFCRRVEVDVASHSPQVDEICDELLGEIVGTNPREASIPLHVHSHR